MIRATLFLLLLTFALLSRAAGLTEQERTVIPKLRAEAERSCREASATKRAALAKQRMSPYRQWATAPVLRDDYCTCATKNVLENPTREELHAEYSDKDKVHAQQSAYACVFEELRRTFPAVCPAIVAELGVPTSRGKNHAVDQLCACI
jgi:hypothetical protein